MEEDYQKYDELTKDISDDYANDPKLQYRRGIIKLCDDKLDEADSLLRKSSKQKKAPKNATVAVNAINAIRTNRAQANAYITKKDQEKAEVFLNKTIESSRMFCSAKAPLVQSTNLLTIKLLKMKNDKHQIIEVLDEMISANPTDMDLILERGDLHLELGDYDAAIFDYNNVQSHNPQNRRAHEGLQKAAEMKKAANHVDYYKLLGVSNSATTEEIKKAYRKLVVQWHPDRQREKEKKQEAEEMMKKINTAYEILCDPQRRRMYDQGIDPDDPMSGPGDDFFSEGFDPFDLLKQTMGGDPFEFMFGGGGGGGGQEFHFEGGQGFQFGGDGFQFHFNF
ncbi:DNAj/HSP40 [Tritrichomonas foetus]|uniref:DNAj/HSP40 n=1 Tax=Tritrichomonas foetus TaxID=1144522 RepID=A0A1J4K4A4_9EUKA|nr:DNAj/HSP40 [Tritrichomonas foetus]|eukprot:OHT04518.1 DNAj/HSP40 [Tritrichomonas foetus]